MDASAKPAVDRGALLVAHRRLLQLRTFLRIVACFFILGAMATNAAFLFDLMDNINPYLEAQGVKELTEHVWIVYTFQGFIFSTYFLFFIAYVREIKDDMEAFKYMLRTDSVHYPQSDRLQRFLDNPKAKPFLYLCAVVVGLVISAGIVSVVTVSEWMDSFKSIVDASGDTDHEAAALKITCTELYSFLLIILVSPTFPTYFWFMFYYPAAHYVFKDIRDKLDRERKLYEQRVAAAQAWKIMRDLSNTPGFNSWVEYHRRARVDPTYPFASCDMPTALRVQVRRHQNGEDDLDETRQH